MRPAAKSIYYFGFYLYLVGVTLIFIPNVLLGILQIEATNEVWIRIVGVLTFCLGFYYNRSGANNDIAFCRLTIPMRIFVFIAFLAFALLKYVSAVLIGFGVIDLVAAFWTWSGLKRDGAAQPATV